MTRSELIQKQIDKIKATCETCKIKNIPGVECCALKLTLELFLAEQKREEGCDKCNDPKILEIQIETGFDFCPHCGRRLTDGESE